MKRFLYFFLVIACAIPGFAQSDILSYTPQDPSSQQANSLLSFISPLKSSGLTKATTWVLDSMLLYENINNQLLLTRKTIVLDLSEQYQPAHIIVRSLDTSTGTWIYHDTIINTYYGQKLHTTLQYPWNKNLNQWADTCFFKEYNEDGWFKTYMQREWDYTNCKFKYGSKDVYSFNSAGMHDTKLTFHWDTTHNKWDKYSKTLYSYFQDTILSSMVILSWDKCSSEWQNYIKWDYQYDTLTSQPSVTTEYQWDYNSSSWVNDSKTEYFFNTQNLPDSILFFTWDPNNNHWFNSEKFTYIYDSLGEMIGYIYLIWDKTSSNWVNDMRYQFIFDDYNLIAQTLQTWDLNNNQWVNKNKIEYIYDDYGNQTDKIYSQWVSGAWKVLNQEKYYYSQITYNSVSSISPNLKISPNPVQDFIFVPGLTNASCQIISLSGHPVKNTRLTNGFIRVKDLEPGMYILVIKTPEKYLTAKFIKL